MVRCRPHVATQAPGGATELGRNQAELPHGTQNWKQMRARVCPHPSQRCHHQLHPRHTPRPKALARFCFAAGPPEPKLHSGKAALCYFPLVDFQAATRKCESEQARQWTHTRPVRNVTGITRGRGAGSGRGLKDDTSRHRCVNVWWWVEAGRWLVCSPMSAVSSAGWLAPAHCSEA